jgi:mono/diheme cytochrome c family protein
MKNRPRSRFTLFAAGALALAAVALVGANPPVGGPLPHQGAPEGAEVDPSPASAVDPVVVHATDMIQRGRHVFRYDRMGSHTFFSRALKLHLALADVTPAQALSLGLKVDSEALPPEVIDALLAGEVDLNDPAVTQFLILSNAVLGVAGEESPAGRLWEVGITCALCHSTVDDSVAPGIGRRLDGWANRDLDVGQIVAIAPNLKPFADLLGVDVATVRTVLRSWGPGKFDAHLNLDGKAFRPDDKTAAVLIPPAFGLAGVNLHTYEGWGSVTYWNAFVGNLEMNGKGTFWDPRLADPVKYPVAAAAGFDEVRDEPDVITRGLAPLHFYQLALDAPAPPPGSFDEAAAERGEALFAGKAACADCHVPPLFTEPGWNLHTPEEIGIDAFQAERGPENRYRTTPLRGLWSHTRGGFYHDGRFATLRAVIDHYDGHFGLGLTETEKADIEQYLRSL